jgi:predicted O-methyltransferase YrrM
MSDAAVQLLRPLSPILSNISGEITEESVAALAAKVEPFFEGYPAHSLMTPMSRAVLYSLIRLLRPRVSAEIGTFFAGTTEVMARAILENGHGDLHTTDPYGDERPDLIIDAWPKELRSFTSFYPLHSMVFFAEMVRRQVPLDLILIDGQHDYEFALFDLQMAARLMRPGGIVIMDNAEQSGPFHAARTFMGENSWREVGGALGTYDPNKPFDEARASFPRTSFLILRAPEHIMIGAGPHSWGEKRTTLSEVRSFSLTLPAQRTRGTLYYQVILRGFADQNRNNVELKMADHFRLPLLRAPETVSIHLPRPLVCDMPSGGHNTVEIELSWQGDRALALSSLPTVAP